MIGRIYAPGGGIEGKYAWEKTKNFELLPNVPYEFYYGGTVVYNNEIHILGGADSTYKHYKWDGSSWTSVSTLPYSFYGGSAVVLNNEIHIMGSNNNHTKHYKWNGSAWTSVSTLPIEFCSGSAVTFNNEIHIMGTAGNANYDTTHYKWNGSSWTSVSTLPYNFYAGSAVVYNDEIHILGGMNTTGRRYHYKWNGSSWVFVSTLPHLNFYEGSALVHKNELHILGGHEYNQHYIYRNGEWVLQNPSAYFIWASGVVSYNNEIYIIGGSNEEPSRFYILDPSTYKKYVVSNKENKYVDGAVTQDGIRYTKLQTSTIDGEPVGSLNLKKIVMDYRDVDLPKSAQYCASVVLNDQIHIIGGGKSSDTLFRGHYVFDGTAWNKHTDINFNFRSGSSVVYNNEIHLLGCTDFQKQHSKINSDGECATVSTLPYESLNSAVIVYNNEIYLLGTRKSGYQKWNYRWNGTAWTYMNNMPYEFDNGCVVLYNNEIHILSSEYSYIDNSTLKSVYPNFQYHYKWNGTAWSSVSTLPLAESCRGAVILNDEIHILYSESHYKWNGSSWTLIGKMPFKNGAEPNQFQVINNEIHILGNKSNEEYERVHYVLNKTLYQKVNN